MIWSDIRPPAAWVLLGLTMLPACAEEPPRPRYCESLLPSRLGPDDPLAFGGTLDERWQQLAGPRIGTLTWHDVSSVITGAPAPGEASGTVELLRWPNGLIHEFDYVDLDDSDDVECPPHVEVEAALSIVSDAGFLDDLWNVELSIDEQEAGAGLTSSGLFRNFVLEFRENDPDIISRLTLSAFWHPDGTATLLLRYSQVEQLRRNRTRGVGSGTVFEWTDAAD